jgi:hypothetical protein
MGEGAWCMWSGDHELRRILQTGDGRLMATSKQQSWVAGPRHTSDWWSVSAPT